MDRTKIPYDPQPFHSADGTRLEGGMPVCVLDRNTGYPMPRIVDSVTEDGRKIIYSEPDPDGTIGARVDAVFVSESVAEQVYKASFMQVQWDEFDGRMLLYAVVQQLKRVRQETEILKIAADRELTMTERMMLPATLRRDSRQELVEQIDPWVGDVLHLESLAKTLEAEIQAINDFESGK